jgi:hypothetical protein
MWDGDRQGDNMSRLGRSMLNVLVMGSLLLCLAMIALWVMLGSTGQLAEEHLGLDQDRLQLVKWYVAIDTGRLKVRRMVDQYREQSGFDVPARSLMYLDL